MTFLTKFLPFKKKNKDIEVLQKEVAELYALLISLARCSDTTPHLLALQALNDEDNTKYLIEVFKHVREMSTSQKVK